MPPAGGIRAPPGICSSWIRNLFSQNWSDNDAQKNRSHKIPTIVFICMCRRQDDQNWYSRSHEMRFRNLFLELDVQTSIRLGQKFWR